MIVHAPQAVSWLTPDAGHLDCSAESARNIRFLQQRRERYQPAPTRKSLAQKTRPTAMNVVVVHTRMARILSPAMASRGDCPTGLDHVGPLIPVRDGHVRDCGVDAEAIGRIEHDWPLHFKLATVRQNGEVHDPAASNPITPNVCGAEMLTKKSENTPIRPEPTTLLEIPA